MTRVEAHPTGSARVARTALDADDRRIDVTVEVDVCLCGSEALVEVGATWACLACGWIVPMDRGGAP